MNAKKAVGYARTSIDSQEINTDTTREELPEDINLINRKNIIREELKKLLGKSFKKQFEELIRLKQKKFNKTKRRRKLALISQKKNW